MFTGLVEEVGVVERVETVPGGRRIRIACERVVAMRASGTASP